MALNTQYDDHMVFVGETPWRGLGEAVRADMTPDEMMVTARLGWKVVQLPLLVQGLHEQRPVTTHVANVRSSDGKVLDVVSKDYHPVQNIELFRFFQRYTEAGDMQMHTAGSLDGGRIVWALAKMNGEFTLPGGKDKTEMHLLLSSGHKSGFALQADLTTVRVVCQNTLMLARGSKGKGGDGEKDGRYRMIHTATWDDNRKGQARRMVEMGRKALDKYHIAAERLIATPFDRATSQAFMVELLQPSLFNSIIEATEEQMAITAAGMNNERREVEVGIRVLDAMLSDDKHALKPEQFSPTVERVLLAMEAQPGAKLFPNTAWSAFNAVTFYVDHVRGQSRDTALNSAWYGPGAGLKADALDLALDYSDRLDAMAGRQTAQLVA